jgi:hypothetical protein
LASRYHALFSAIPAGSKVAHWPVEYAYGIGEIKAVLSTICLVFGRVPFEFHRAEPYPKWRDGGSSGIDHIDDKIAIIVC